MKKTLPALICAAFLGTAAQAAQVDIFGAVDMYVGVNNAGGEWRTGLQSGGLTHRFERNRRLGRRHTGILQFRPGFLS